MGNDLLTKTERISQSSQIQKVKENLHRIPLAFFCVCGVPNISAKSLYRKWFPPPTFLTLRFPARFSQPW